MTQEQTYDIEAMRRELGRLGYALTQVGHGPMCFAWGLGDPRKHGAEAYADSEIEAWFAALEHARHDKSLTGAKLDILIDMGYDPWLWDHTRHDDEGERTGATERIAGSHGPREVSATHSRRKAKRDWGKGATSDEAINALWETVCLRGGTT